MLAEIDPITIAAGVSIVSCLLRGYELHIRYESFNSASSQYKEDLS